MLSYFKMQFSDCLWFQVVKHRKPRKITQYWIRYTCGAVGFSICSIWLLQHSRLMGSSDIDNWIQEAKDSTVSFFTEHVEQPVHFFLSMRHTIRQKRRGVAGIWTHNCLNANHYFFLSFTFSSLLLVYWHYLVLKNYFFKDQFPWAMDKYPFLQSAPFKLTPFPSYIC